MRRINTIRGLGRLTPPLICQKPNTRGRYEDAWSCDADDQLTYACREAMPEDTTPEAWAATGCGRAVSSVNVTVAPTRVSPQAQMSAPPAAPAITGPRIVSPPAGPGLSQRQLEEERARILANQNRAEEERLARLRIAEEERQRQLELDRQRIQAELEQRRIQEELERNRRQLAERQQVTVTVPVNAPPGVETQKGGFPWWLLALLLASQ